MTINIIQPTPQGFSISLAGPQGPAGAAGAAGAAGTNGTNGSNGTNGTNGTNGATWLSGSGAPGSGTGVVNDFYLDTASSDVYKKTGSSTWTLQVNIKGPTGDSSSIGTQFGDAANGEAIGLDTGVIFGGEINANEVSPTAVDIGATIGYIIDYITTPATPTVTRIQTDAQTVELDDTVSVLTWWSLDSSGQVIQQTSRPTNSQRRTRIQLGVTAINDGAIFVDQTLPVILPQPTNQLYDLMYALGAFNIEGNNLSAASTNLQLTKSSGQVFFPGFNHFAGPTLTNDPHVSTVVAQSPVSIRYSTRTPAAPVPTVTSIDPTKYDASGIVTTIPGGPNVSTIQRVYLFPVNDVADQIVIQYGQNTYTSLANAVSSIGTDTFIQNPTLADGILIGFIIVTKSCTNLADTTTAKIIKAGKFGVGAAGTALATVDLLAANNLSDLENVATARTNLGLGTYATRNVDPSVFNVMDYGAVGDGKMVIDGAMTASSNVLTCATSTPFSSADVGKVIMVKGASSTPQTTLVTTIAGFTSSSVVTLANSAVTTVTGGLVMFGTDDTAEIQAAIDAAVNYAQAHSGNATVWIPAAPGMFYAIGGPLVTSRNGNSQLTLEPIASTLNKISISIESYGSGSGLQHWEQLYPTVSGATLVSFGAFSSSSAQVTSINNGGNAAVIGGPSQPGGYGVAPGVFSNMHVTLKNISILTTYSFHGLTYTAFDFSGIANAHIENIAYGTTGNVPSGDFGTPSSFANGLSIGALMPAAGNNDHCIIKNVTVHGGYTYGFFATEHSVIDTMRLLYCWSGFCPVGNYYGSVGATHAIKAQQLSVEACSNVIYIIGVGSAGIGPFIDIDQLDTESGAPTFADNTSGNGLACALGTIKLTGLYTQANVTVAHPTGLKIIDGQRAYPVITKTSNYTTIVTDDTIIGDATSGNMTVTLHSPLYTPNSFTIYKKDATANTVSIDTGAGTVTLTTQGQSAKFIPVSGVWVRII